MMYLPCVEIVVFNLSYDLLDYSRQPGRVRRPCWWLGAPGRPGARQCSLLQEFSSLNSNISHTNSNIFAGRYCKKESQRCSWVRDCETCRAGNELRSPITGQLGALCQCHEDQSPNFEPVRCVWMVTLVFSMWSNLSTSVCPDLCVPLTSLCASDTCRLTWWNCKAHRSS